MAVSKTKHMSISRSSDGNDSDSIRIEIEDGDVKVVVRMTCADFARCVTGLAVNITGTTIRVRGEKL